MCYFGSLVNASSHSGGFLKDGHLSFRAIHIVCQTSVSYAIRDIAIKVCICFFLSYMFKSFVLSVIAIFNVHVH